MAMSCCRILPLLPISQCAILRDIERTLRQARHKGRSPAFKDTMPDELRNPASSMQGQREGH